MGSLPPLPPFLCPSLVGLPRLTVLTMLTVMSDSAQEEGAAAEDVPRGLLERRESVPFVLLPPVRHSRLPPPPLVRLGANNSNIGTTEYGGSWADEVEEVVGMSASYISLLPHRCLSNQ